MLGSVAIAWVLGLAPDVRLQDLLLVTQGDSEVVPELPELREKAKITLVSATSIVEGGSHDVILKDKFGRD